MNYVQILATPLSALKNITAAHYADLLTSTVQELSSLCSMQTSEHNPETFRSRRNVIDRLTQTRRVLERHELYNEFVTMLRSRNAGTGKSLVPKALQNLRSSQTASA